MYSGSDEEMEFTNDGGFRSSTPTPGLQPIQVNRKPKQYIRKSTLFGCVMIRAAAAVAVQGR